MIAQLIQWYAEEGKCATRREVYPKQVCRLRGVDDERFGVGATDDRAVKRLILERSRAVRYAQDSAAKIYDDFYRTCRQDKLGRAHRHVCITQPKSFYEQSKWRCVSNHVMWRAARNQYVPRGRSELHTILERHFEDFCEHYDEQYAVTYGMYRLERIQQLGKGFCTCGDYLSLANQQAGECPHLRFEYQP